jgi:putative hydrolase of the HAD superfamily
MLPKAILFDLDDTLVSFDGIVTPAWKETCGIFAKQADVSGETLYQAIRDYGRWYWSDPDRHRQGRLVLEETRRQCVARALITLGRQDDDLARRLADHYSALQESRIELYPDTLETLDFFKEHNVGLALVTNGNAAMQRRKIKRFRLERYFPHCFVEGELGYGKPDPRVFSDALRALGAEPAATWCVGDNLVWDVAGAQACGITGIWKKPEGKEQGDITPDRIIRRLRELIPDQAGGGRIVQPS